MECREDTDASIMEGEYEWVREYLYDVRQDEEKRTYILRENPSYMGYVDLNTRLMVHKRGKRMKSDAFMSQEFPRPSQVHPFITKHSTGCLRFLCLR